MNDAPTGQLAMFAMADELDLAPRRLRAALVKPLARLAEAGFSLDSARQHAQARIASAQEVMGARPAPSSD